MATFRESLLNKAYADDTARLWYNENASRKEGKPILHLTEEYLAQNTFQSLLDAGWEPVRAGKISVMESFWRWIENNHNDIPTRDELRRNWFDFIKTTDYEDKN